MDFSEYIMALNATKQKYQGKHFQNKAVDDRLTTPEEKLRWIFNVFDRDGGGSIDAAEIKEMVSGLFAMAGVSGNVFFIKVMFCHSSGGD